MAPWCRPLKCPESINPNFVFFLRKIPIFFATKMTQKRHTHCRKTHKTKISTGRRMPWISWTPYQQPFLEVRKVSTPTVPTKVEQHWVRMLCITSIPQLFTPFYTFFQKTGKNSRGLGTPFWPRGRNTVGLDPWTSFCGSMRTIWRPPWGKSSHARWAPSPSPMAEKTSVTGVSSP